MDDKLLKQRDELIFKNNKPKYLGGIERFDRVELETLLKLEEIGVLNLNNQFNCAPSTGEFIEFLKLYPRKFAAHGFVESHSRKNSKVVIEGVESIEPLDLETKLDAVLTFRHADSLDCDERFYCWYD